LRSNVSDAQINRRVGHFGPKFRGVPLVFASAEREHPRLTKGLTKTRRRVDGSVKPVVRSVMRATGPPPVLPLTTGHLIAGRTSYLGVKTTVRRLARRKFECLPIAKSLYFYVFYYIISISRPWDREEGTGGWDRDAGTNVTKLPGQRVGRDRHAGTWTS